MRSHLYRSFNLPCCSSGGLSGPNRTGSALDSVVFFVARSGMYTVATACGCCKVVRMAAPPSIAMILVFPASVQDRHRNCTDWHGMSHQWVWGRLRTFFHPLLGVFIDAPQEERGAHQRCSVTGVRQRRLVSRWATELQRGNVGKRRVREGGGERGGGPQEQRVRRVQRVGWRRVSPSSSRGSA